MLTGLRAPSRMVYRGTSNRIMDSRIRRIINKLFRLKDRAIRAVNEVVMINR